MIRIFVPSTRSISKEKFHVGIHGRLRKLDLELRYAVWTGEVLNLPDRPSFGNTSLGDLPLHLLIFELEQRPGMAG